MLLRRFFIVVLSILVSAPAWASRPTFNYLGAGYTRQHLDAGCRQDGLYLEGSLALNEVAFVQANHVDVTSDNGCGSTTTSLTLGIRGNVSNLSVIYLAGTMINRDYGPDSDAGFGATLGFRSTVAPGTELRGFVTYEAVDDWRETFFGIGLNRWFARAFSLSADISTSDEDTNAFSVGLRFNFF
jgi:hypothetical protein